MAEVQCPRCGSIWDAAGLPNPREHRIHPADLSFVYLVLGPLAAIGGGLLMNHFGASDSVGAVRWGFPVIIIGIWLLLGGIIVIFRSATHAPPLYMCATCMNRENDASHAASREKRPD